MVLAYYRTSLGYLFGMSLHPYEPVVSFIAHSQQKGAYDFGDVLDFSGGVGANVLLLATHRVRTTYSAVSVLDTAFVRYRVARRGLTRNVSFIEPYSARTNWRLDPPAALMEHHERFGVILAIGVLEHIDHFERTVRAMVHALRPGGWIVESSPFTSNTTEYDKYGVVPHGEDDTRLHVSNRGIAMAAAMGPMMSQETSLHGFRHPSIKVWRKLA